MKKLSLLGGAIALALTSTVAVAQEKFITIGTGGQTGSTMSSASRSAGW